MGEVALYRWRREQLEYVQRLWPQKRLKPRPESGRDCLIYAEFARQRNTSGRVWDGPASGQIGPPRDRWARLGTDRLVSGHLGPPRGRWAHLGANVPASGQIGPPRDIYTQLWTGRTHPRRSEPSDPLVGEGGLIRPPVGRRPLRRSVVQGYFAHKK